jgi:parallel beta-helix repeat protein
MVRESLLHVFLVATIFCGLLFVNNVPFGMAQEGLITVINSDTTWTKADSPYSFTGQLLVEEGATLTIEAGVTADFNGHYMRVNGILRALGNSDEKIYFNNLLRIEFTESSEGWDEQTGSGNVIENVISNAEISSIVSLKVNNSVTDGIDAEDSSVISNTEIGGWIVAGDSVKISGNTIENNVKVGSSSEIIHNTISGSVETQNTVISNNNIKFSVTADGSTISDNEVGNGITGSSLVITDNVVTVSSSSTKAAISIEGGSSVISGNTFSGGGDYSLFGITVPIGALDIESGSAVISDNDITGNGIRLSGHCGSLVIKNNRLSAGVFCAGDVYNGIYYPDVWQTAESFEISGNVITGEVEVKTGALSVSNNEIVGTGKKGIVFSVYGEETASIMDNTVYGCSSGIEVNAAAPVLIKRNSITNCTEHGIHVVSSDVLTIVGNSIINNENGITLDSHANATIDGNYIGDNSLGINGPGDSTNRVITNNSIIRNGLGIVGPGTGTIERNNITANNCGIVTSGNVTIRNNTISYNYFGIKGYLTATIRYNNIYNNTYGIYHNGANDFDVSYNWWGTTDTQAINLTIHDSKYAFDVGTVTFTPFLTEPNSETEPLYTPDVPEFPTWIILPLVLALLLVVLFFRKKTR